MNQPVILGNRKPSPHTGWPTVCGPSHCGIVAGSTPADRSCEGAVGRARTGNRLPIPDAEPAGPRGPAGFRRRNRLLTLTDRLGSSTRTFGGTVFELHTTLAGDRKSPRVCTTEPAPASR